MLSELEQILESAELDDLARKYVDSVLPIVEEQISKESEDDFEGAPDIPDRYGLFRLYVSAMNKCKEEYGYQLLTEGIGAVAVVHLESLNRGLDGLILDFVKEKPSLPIEDIERGFFSMAFYIPYMRDFSNLRMCLLNHFIYIDLLREGDGSDVHPMCSILSDMEMTPELCELIINETAWRDTDGRYRLLKALLAKEYSSFDELREIAGINIPGYIILKKASFGGLGVVYKAVNDDGDIRAIKILQKTKEKHSTARTEVYDGVGGSFAISDNEKIPDALKHTNIIKYYTRGEVFANGDVRPYIVLEWVEGRTLEDVMKNESLNDEKYYRIAKQLIDAVRHIHKNGYMHGDIKPNNIMIDDKGRVTLLDFSTARECELGAPVTKYLHGLPICEEVYFGNPLYMSPAVLRREKGVGQSSDIWALAVVLYQLANKGEHPFHPYDTKEGIRKVMSDPDLFRKTVRIEEYYMKIEPPGFIYDDGTLFKEIEGARPPCFMFSYDFGTSQLGAPYYLFNIENVIDGRTEWFDNIITVKKFIAWPGGPWPEEDWGDEEDLGDFEEEEY